MLGMKSYLGSRFPVTFSGSEMLDKSVHLSDTEKLGEHLSSYRCS